MICEILSIGDELLIGQIVNTNAAYLAKRMAELGHEVKWIVTVGDDPDDLRKAFEISWSRSEIVIATGGLGPTHDDITKRIAADYFDSKLIYNPEIFENLKRMFESRGVPLSDTNKDQAYVPEKAQIIPNPVGTAPALLFEEDGKSCFILPGVPSEMKAICEASVFPSLKNSERVIQFRTVRTTGIAESTLFERLGDIQEIEAYVRVAFLPKFAGVDIRLTAYGRSEAECTDKMSSGLDLVRSQVGKYIYSEEDREIAEVVAELLNRAGKTVAVAESCTGGLFANKLTNISGSSGYFERGVVTYSNEAKMAMVNVPEETLIEFGAVSSETAIAMAEGIRAVSGTDFGISTTGVAGPTGGTKEKPVGLVYIGFASKQGSYSKMRRFLKDRIGNKERTVQAALDLLRKELLALRS
ncbi:competence/damage-inducible protein A [bacterium]|nr:competence/damage-inducible protein A [bacterium]